MKKQAIILTGLPACGKSSVVEDIKSIVENDSSFGNWAVISPDSILEEIRTNIEKNTILHNEPLSISYNDVYDTTPEKEFIKIPRTTYGMCKSLAERQIKALNKNYNNINIIYDDICLKKNERIGLIHFLKKCNYELFYSFYIDVSLVTIQKRNIIRTMEENKNIPDSVYKSMIKQMSIPQKDNGFDQLYTILNDNSVTPEERKNKIFKIMKGIRNYEGYRRNLGSTV